LQNGSTFVSVPIWRHIHAPHGDGLSSLDSVPRAQSWGCSSSRSTGATDQVFCPPSTQPPPAKTGPIGTTFTVNGVRVTLERVIDPASAALAYTFPRAGTRYVAAVLDLVNTSENPSTDSPFELLNVVDGDAAVVLPDFTRVAECSQNFTAGTFTLGPFEEQHGCVAFKVPLGTQPAIVRYASPNPSEPDVAWNLGHG